MKKFNLIITSLLICLFIVSCDDNSSGLTGGNSDSGWIEFDSSSTDGLDNVSIVEIPFSLPYGTNAQGIDLTYSIGLVSGVFPSSSLGNFTTRLVAGETDGTIEFPVINNGENYELKFTLLSSSNPDYQIGLSDNSKQITHTLAICHFEVSSTYTGDGFSNDLSVSSGSFPPFTVDFVPVTGSDNTWSLVTTWGPDFVNLLCGGCVPPGAFPYPSIVTLMDDNSVTVTGDQFYTSGGSGTYDPCTDTFTLNIGQALFNGTFTVDVSLTGN